MSGVSRPAARPEDQAAAPKAAPVTVSHLFGEITWLFGQSSRHRDVTVEDLTWLVMPAILARQFHLFRDAERPVGVALWAYLDADGERKIMAGLRATGARLEAADWAAGDRLWLVELVAPFATPENRHAELMIGDLVAGQFQGKAFRMLQAEGRVVEVPADAGAQIVRGTLGMMAADSRGDL